jgi:hypothetical protein
MAIRIDYTQPQAGLQGDARTRKDLGRRVTVTTADLATGAQIAAFRVPAGFTVTSINCVFNTQLDSNGSPTLTISVGDAASSTRYLNASTGGRTAGTIVNAFTTPAGGTNLLFNYTTDTDILITATAGAATAVAGTIDLYLGGFIANP